MTAHAFSPARWVLPLYITKLLGKYQPRFRMAVATQAFVRPAYGVTSRNHSLLNANSPSDLTKELPMSIRRKLPLLGLLALSFAAPLMAQPIQPFSTSALKAAQAAGKPVLVDAYASWCPTCRKQAPTIDAMAKDPAFDKLLILRLDYDNQADEKRALGITQQSTLIAFTGSKEAGRSVGITDPDQIKALAKSAMP
jgi:thioredoxin 1